MNKRLQQTALGVALLFGALAPAHAFAATESVSAVAGVSATTATSVAKNIIASGTKYLGTPYLYGADASQTSNFDCSSFTFRAFIENGINLPRSSNDQMKEGFAVTMDTAQPGDLLFFRDTTYPDQAGHVGIYLGNNEMLHASASKGVTITSLSTPYWQNRFMAVKRVIPMTYTVQSGDTMWKISRNTGISLSSLRTWNWKTVSGDALVPGMLLYISEPDLLMGNPGEEMPHYTVQSGDTLWGISQKLNVTVDQLKSWNNMTANDLYTGQILKLNS
ncbi:Murein DD-endopeptidase MepS/Murein LD-carboxypeptidase precursor [compost metagenome]